MWRQGKQGEGRSFQGWEFVIGAICNPHKATGRTVACKVRRTFERNRVEQKPAHNREPGRRGGSLAALHSTLLETRSAPLGLPITVNHERFKCFCYVAAVRSGWQKDYFQGRDPGTETFAEHQTKLKLPLFET